MIRSCTPADFDAILQVINDGASAYKGVIPDDCWHEPYMPADELRHEMASGVVFSGEEVGGSLVGVMGSQSLKDVVLVRHAYVLSHRQRQGTGSRLLEHLFSAAPRPVLIGTWAAARWALRFYEKNGFTVVGEEEKDRMLDLYWDIPKRQVETSVVLADERACREIVGTSGDNAEGKFSALILP